MILSTSLLLSITPLLVLSAPAPYEVTQYVQLSVSSYPAYTNTYFSGGSPVFYAGSAYTRTEILTLAVPTTPVSALTTITTFSPHSHVTIINVVLPTGTTPPYNDSSTSYHTTHVVPVTYTPDPTCTSQNWSFATRVPIYIPPIVSLSPINISTRISTYTNYLDEPVPTTDVVALLNPSDVDEEDLASVSDRYRPWGLSFCYTPTVSCYSITATDTATTTANATAAATDSAECTKTVFRYPDDPSSLDYPSTSHSTSHSWPLALTTIILICVFVVLTWTLIFLALGLWESWLSFKGLMLGLHRKRGLPYAWCCINMFILCFVGPTYRSKSKEEQVVLRKKWDAMGKGEKLRLWFMWGFRWKYPDVLGDQPEVARRALRERVL